jgi:two-component system, NtrC family, sensor kinase
MPKPRGQKRPTQQRTIEPPQRRGPGSDASELALAKQLWNFGSQFREGSEPDKVFRGALRLGFEHFGSDEGCVVSIPPGRDEPEILHREPRESLWDRALLASFLRGQKVTVPPDTMLARIRRHDRMWGALAVRRRGADFRWDARQAFSSIGVLAGQLVSDMDAARVREVRNRIDRKLLDQVGPKNLFYEILHGLRSLTSYDHSAALLIYDENEPSLEIVAEQISWRKAKSQIVGRRLPLPPETLAFLRSSEIAGFDRDERGWRTWTAQGDLRLAELMDFCRTPDEGQSLVSESCMLCAPLMTREGLLGLLKVAAVRNGTFCRHEAEMIAQFLPQAALALHGWRRTQSLEMQVLAAERKHAMADLARGVAHDINNALGVVLPLVQQLQDDVAQNDVDPTVAAADLREIEQSLQLCRRIFGGMLRFARSMARNASEVSLRDAVESALAILRDSLERRGIEIKVDVPISLPPIESVQADVEQLLMNLMNNAADAMQDGGRLSIRARKNPDSLELSVEDTGCGIGGEHLVKIEEPFFTTKPTGNGLGLAICRSIASQMGGRLHFDSQIGKGTRVTLTIPLRNESAP